MPQIKPQKHHRLPKYPTMEQIAHDPELLKSLPTRWHAKPAVCAALAFTLSSGLYSCTAADNSAPSDLHCTLSPDGGSVSGEGLPDSDEAQGGLYVPLFEYGEGRGAFGCVSVTAPLFLSEDEAAQIIIDEADKLGVEFNRRSAPTVSNANIPETSLGNYDDLGTVKGELKTDGHSEDAAFSFEFVSRDDYLEWEAPGKGPMSTVSRYDIKDAAKRLAENNKNVAVFYDPMSLIERTDDFYTKYDAWFADFVKSKGLDMTGDYYIKLTDEDRETADKKWREMYEETREAARIRSESDLRAQVKGFIEWLKGQGVI